MICKHTTAYWLLAELLNEMPNVLLNVLLNVLQLLAIHPHTHPVMRRRPQAWDGGVWGGVQSCIAH